MTFLDPFYFFLLSNFILKNLFSKSENNGILPSPTANGIRPTKRKKKIIKCFFIPKFLKKTISKTGVKGFFIVQ